jgi:hypothetical protein
MSHAAVDSLVQGCRTRTGVGVKLKTGVTAVVVAFVIFFVLSSPDNAATIAHGAWNTVVHIAHGLNTFLDKLSS